MTARAGSPKATTVIAALPLLLLGTFAWAQSSPEKVPADRWSLFRGDAAMTGFSSAEIPRNPAQLWFFETQDSIEATAAIVDDVVYIPTMDGRFYALALSSGKEIWKFENPEQDAAKSSPCVAGELVYYGDDLGTFRALDRKTGHLRWSHKAEGEIISSPTVLDGKVLYGSYDECLYCLDALSGKENWVLKTQGPVHCSPSKIGKEVVVAGCDGFLRFVDIDTGKETKALEIGGNIASTPAVVGATIYFGTMSNQVIRLNTRTMEREWTYEHPKRDFPFYSSAAVNGEMVFIGGRNKLMHALDAANGEVKWTHPTEGRVDSSPVIVGDRVFFGSNDGNIYAADLKTGQTRWEFPTGSAVTASPAVAKGRLVIGTQDGTIYCFGSSAQ